MPTEQQVDDDALCGSSSDQDQARSDAASALEHRLGDHQQNHQVPTGRAPLPHRGLPVINRSTRQSTCFLLANPSIS